VIFKPRLARLVVAGKKTQTRRPVKDGEPICRYRPGREYAVQPGRGKAQIARLKVIAVAREPLGELTFDAARAEGFRTRDDFMAYWEELYGRIDVDLPVWAIAFELVRDEIRYLHRDSSHGYTANEREAMDDEPEAVDDKTLAWITKEARVRFTQMKAEDIARQDARARANRLRDIERRAVSNGTDIAAERATIDAAVESMRRKVSEAA
jgi:hypothetical protein